MQYIYDQSATVNDIASYPGLQYKGRDYMALPNRAFSGEDGPFGVIFTHAMMHPAGAVPKDTHSESRFSISGISTINSPTPNLQTKQTVEVKNAEGQHDLTWMDKKLYDSIIENCAKK